MKKIIYATPFITLFVLLVIHSKYVYYQRELVDEVIFWVIPILLNVILLGIGWLGSLLQKLIEQGKQEL